MKNALKYIFLLLLVVVLDQAAKLWIHNHMQLGPDGPIKLLGNLFRLTYVLNYGMAFGWQWHFKYGKLLITWVRIVASICIARYTIWGFLRSAPSGWIYGWVLVLAGAIGNSIDSIFYGVYLNNAPDIAFMKWFHGQVIDMFHLNFWSGMLPSWLPIWGGEVVCLLPIFNVADLSICSGLLCMLCSYKQVTAWEKERLVR